MTYLEAACHVLAQAGAPLHYAEITRRALAQSLITPTGLTHWRAATRHLRSIGVIG